MPLPETIRVKLSSEEAGAVSITPVVVREMPVRELVELMLGVTGKDAGRVQDLLLRGALVSGATRFRWQGCAASREEIDRLLETFPDPEPGRPFAPERCTRVALRGAGFRIELTRQAGSARRLFRRRSFWDALMALAVDTGVEYVEYSYKEHSDCYRLRVDFRTGARLREQAGLVRYSSLEKRIRDGLIEAVELFVER
ncbi:MAG TPA: hypothetical protein VNJ11_05480 [Bryobacteraceae bacterium]|nr:hypothetical protein [Bryobacteraceae bacterium]